MNTQVIEHSIAFIDSWLGYQIRQDTLPGLSVAVYCKNDIVFSGAYGRADKETNEVLTTEHLFQIGSQTKMLTATTILQLARKSQLSLDDPVAKHLPWLRDHADQRFGTFTIRQLLCHEAGIARDGYPADFWQLQKPFPDKGVLKEMILDSSFHAYKGTRFKYSNLGYALLGQVIETVSGQPYAECVKSYILQPLSLDAIQPYSEKFAAPVAKGYLRPVNGYRMPVDVAVSTNAFTSVAGWYATPTDVCRFLAKQFDAENQMLSELGDELAWRPRNQHWRPEEQRGTPYGLGFMRYEYLSYQLTGHSGSFVGHGTYGFFDPTHGLAVVVMANAKDAPINHIGEGILGVFDHFGQYGAGSVSANQKRLNARLMNLWQTVEVVATSNRVVVVDPDSWAPFENIIEELTPLGPTTFKIEQTHDLALLDEVVTFYFDEKDALQWVDYGGSTAMPEQRYLWWMNNQKNRANS